MTLQETYKQQANALFREGDKVRVVRDCDEATYKAVTGNADTSACLCGLNKDVYTILTIDKDGDVLLDCDEYCAWWCLELVEKSKPDIAIGGDNVEICKDYIKAGCQVVTRETIDRIVKRMDSK